jgi:ABC-type dipeptide/oligopeptide/nickel transport system permease component
MRRSFADSASIVLAVAGAAIPIYWLGLMLQILLGVHLHWLPPSGYGSWRHLVLPAFSLGVFLAPVTMRLVRSGMIEALAQDYVRTARAKGMPEGAVLLRHALRNMLIPVLTVLGLQFGQLMGGASSPRRSSRGRGWRASSSRRSRTRTSPSRRRQ